MGGVQTTVDNYDMVTNLKQALSNKNLDRINEYLKKYKKVLLYYDDNNMKKLLPKWQETLKNRQIKNNHYIINRMLDNDFSMRSNVKCKLMDQYLVCNPTLYSEFTVLRNLLFRISPRISKISEGDKCNKATCLFKSNYNIIESAIKAILNKIIANKNYISYPCKEPNKLVELSGEEIDFIRHQLYIIFRHFNIFSDTFGFDKNYFKINGNINSVNIFLKTANDMYDDLSNVINNNKNIEYISFYSIFSNMKLFLNVIQTSINLRIKERISRNRNGDWGWHSYQANLWYYFKNSWLSQIQDDVNNCFRSCEILEQNKIEILDCISNIIENKHLNGLKDINILKSYVNPSDRINYIYGKVLDQF